MFPGGTFEEELWCRVCSMF